MKVYDVAVVGGGNAGLCAAITARRAGASVLLLEQAPKEMRGGDSRHARNLRVAHDMPSRYWNETYPPDEYWDDLRRASAGHTDESLARLMIEKSAHAMRWMMQCGAQFQALSSGTRRPSRKTTFLLGGGKALLNAYYLTAMRLGIDIRYSTEVVAAQLDDGIARSITVVDGGLSATIHAKAFVVSSGGIHSGIDRLKRRWGDASTHFLVRGRPCGGDNFLKALLGQGLTPVGNPDRWYIVAIDGRAPKFDSGIASRIDCVHLGIVVDKNGRRFHDEGKDIGPKRYAIWGDLVASCPDQIAYAILDSKVEGLFRSPLYPPIQAPTIAELGIKLALDPVAFQTTVSAFNAAVRSSPSDKSMSGGHTANLAPPKSRHALSIDTPPFVCFPLRPGLTFSYFGVKVDHDARVFMSNGCTATNLFAAGSIMAANILGCGYLSGLGLTIGTVFGQIAGREAAQYANDRHQ